MTISRNPKPLRTPAEKQVGEDLQAVFEASTDSIEVRLENFPKYVRRQHLTRFLALHELFKRVLHVKGSVVECGVNRGYGLMSWAKLSAILEPNNLIRKVYGFDTFEGFPKVGDRDVPGSRNHEAPKKGGLAADSYDELKKLIELFNRDRFLGHMSKVELIQGDAAETIPEFIKTHPHLVVSLLFLDFDLFEPTKAALTNFLPRMPKGAIVAFDELDNPLWPGETLAVMETIGFRGLRLERFDFDPYIAFAEIT